MKRIVVSTGHKGTGKVIFIRTYTIGQSFDADLQKTLTRFGYFLESPTPAWVYAIVPVLLAILAMIAWTVTQ